MSDPQMTQADHERRALLAAFEAMSQVMHDMSPYRQDGENGLLCQFCDLAPPDHSDRFCAWMQATEKCRHARLVLRDGTRAALAAPPGTAGA